MKNIIISVLLLGNVSMQANQVLDSINVVTINSPELINASGKDCQTCIVVLKTSDNLVNKKISFENGEEISRTEFEYYSSYPGKLFSISMYENKQLVEFRDQISEADSSNYSGKFYFENGKIASEGLIKSSLRDGVWNYYYDSGKLKQTIKYSGGLKNGKYKDYGTTGKIATEGNYLNDSTVGKWAEYDSSGELVEEYEFINGERIIKPIKLNRAERIRKSMNQFQITDNDLHGSICFYNIEKKDTMKTIVSGERISVQRKSGMPEITDGFLKAIKDSNVYVSNRNIIGNDADFIKIPMSDILRIGYLRTFQTSPGSTYYTGPNYRMFNLDDPKYKVSFSKFGKHRTNFNETE